HTQTIPHIHTHTQTHACPLSLTLLHTQTHSFTYVHNIHTNINIYINTYLHFTQMDTHTPFTAKRSPGRSSLQILPAVSVLMYSPECYARVLNSSTCLHTQTHTLTHTYTDTHIVPHTSTTT